MKSYTNIEQSKKLAEILPLESADMIWVLANPDLPMIRAIAYKDSDYNNKYYEILPAWSLTALMDVLDRGAVFKTPKGWVCQTYIEYKAITSDYYNNPIDACYEMILKLHELNLL